MRSKNVRLPSSGQSSMIDTHVSPRSASSIEDGDKEEHTRMKRMLRYFQKKDEIILKVTDSSDLNDVKIADFSDIIHSMSPIDNVMNLEFFHRINFYFA